MYSALSQMDIGGGEGGKRDFLIAGDETVGVYDYKSCAPVCTNEIVSVIWQLLGALILDQLSRPKLLGTRDLRSTICHRTVAQLSSGNPRLLDQGRYRDCPSIDT